LSGNKARRLLEVLASDLSAEQKIATLRSDPLWKKTVSPRLCKLITALGSNPEFVLGYEAYLKRCEERERQMELARARSDAESQMRAISDLHGGTHHLTPIPDMEPEPYSPPEESQGGTSARQSPTETDTSPISEISTTHWLGMGLGAVIALLATAFIVARSRRKRTKQAE